MFFYNLTNTRFSVFLFVIALSIVYMWMPLLVNFILSENEFFLKLAFMTLFSCISILFGFYLPIFNSRFRSGALRVTVGSNTVHTFVWLVFLSFLFITLYTAPAIPLVSALHGATTDELSIQRGAFLKGREGIETALIYISTMFVSAFLPYSLAKMFVDKNKYRYLFLFIFFGYSVSFLQKALFLNALLPLLYVTAQRKKISSSYAILIAVGCGAILYVVTLLAMGEQEAAATVSSGGMDSPEFYSSKYLPANALDHLIWRIVAVPMFTASDTLWVLTHKFQDEPLWGATSSFFSSIFSLDRVYLEKLVFEHEWGWNETANSNAVYFTEGYANFGWLGVGIYSFFVGQTFQWFKKSDDAAFKSLWLIYFLGLFTGGLIGTLLSNGYLLMFFACFFLKVRPPKKRANKKDTKTGLVVVKPL